jgi:hypothetical protein
MFKKIIMGCLLSGVILTSCSKNTADVNASASKRLTKAELYADLKAFNAVHAVKPECDGFWGCLGKVAAVAGADIMGACGGVVAVKEAAAAVGIATGGTGAIVTMAAAGAIVGGGASYSAAKTLASAAKPARENYSHMGLDIPLKYDGLRDVGIKHNAAMYDVYFGGQGVTADYYIGTLGVPTSYMPVINSDIYQGRMEIAKNIGRDYVLSGFNYEFLTNEAYSERLITDDMRQVLLSFMEAYGTGANIQSVIDHYISVVDQSELTETERQALIAGFIVGSESPYVFYNNIIEE